MSYIYVKQSQPQLVHKTPKAPHVSRLSKKKRKYIAFGLFALGFFFFGSVIFPVVQFQLEYAVKFNQLVNPLSTKFYNRSGNVLGDLTTDYTQISNWFVPETNAVSPDTFSNKVSQSYTISIPNLKIKDAVVDVGSLDLKKSLIQYPQTALPGQAGNSVVFGHSVLPQFFNPKSYLTIFSTLYKLKQGDHIIVNFDNVEYKYLVVEMYEVQPTDLSVLEQRFDGKYLTLVTCSPPGTVLRRLVVKSQIVDM